MAINGSKNYNRKLLYKPLVKNFKWKEIVFVVCRAFNTYCFSSRIYIFCFKNI